jgi:hypothetical protein
MAACGSSCKGRWRLIDAVRYLLLLLLLLL